MFSEATHDVAPAGGNAPGRAKEPWGLGGLATRRYCLRVTEADRVGDDGIPVNGANEGYL